jgi:hypothetical protein
MSIELETKISKLEADIKGLTEIVEKLYSSIEWLNSFRAEQVMFNESFREELVTANEISDKNYQSAHCEIGELKEWRDDLSKFTTLVKHIKKLEKQFYDDAADMIKKHIKKGKE